jgi:hypothetical protein
MIRPDRMNFPKLSDDERLMNEALQVAEMLRYYADLLDDPKTTALEIFSYKEVDLNGSIESIYLKLLTDDPEVHARMIETEPEISILSLRRPKDEIE